MGRYLFHDVVENRFTSVRSNGVRDPCMEPEAFESNGKEIQNSYSNVRRHRRKMGMGEKDVHKSCTIIQGIPSPRSLNQIHPDPQESGTLEASQGLHISLCGPSGIEAASATDRVQKRQVNLETQENVRIDSVMAFIDTE